MALVAIDAVVHIAPHTLMLLIGPGLGMAPRTSEHCVVRRVGVARGTHAICPAMASREPGVVEGRSLPRSSGVTGLAGRGEARCRVVRVSRGLVVRPMA